MGAKAEFSIDLDTLNSLRNEGVVSEFLEARLQFIESFHLRNQHIRPLGACVNCGFYPGEKPKLECDDYVPLSRCYPNMMGPQSSGRMSVSDPPLINFTADKKYGPDGVRDVVVPDLGDKWVACDWEAIEARFISHRSGDEGDNEAFRKAWDIHTVTAQRMFRWPEFTFEPLKKIIYGEPGREWCAHVGWIIHRQTCHLKDHAGCKAEPFHDDHRYRRLAKNCRYCVPMDTQALTRRGWKRYEELQVGEDVLTYNAEKGTKEWAPIEDLIYFDDAEVWEVGHAWLKVRATAEHRWFTRERRRHGWQEVVLTTGELNSHSNIIMNAPMTPDAESRWHGNGLLPKYSTDWVAQVVSMSSAERQAFLAGFLIADGYYDKWGWKFSQVRGPLLDAIHTAAYIEHDGVIRLSGDREGQKPGRPCVVGRLSTKGHMTGQRLTRRSLGHQPVWCLTTRNGSWVMKQGDVITITGNCLQYAFNEKAMARYAVEMKMPKEQLWQFGKLYLASKPVLVSWKKRTWAECWRTHEARTFMDRRRRLGGSKNDVMKEGLNHIIQGSVADMMKTTLRLVLAAYPMARLAYQSHDGFKFVFPRNVVVGSRIREIVEREVIAWGKPINFPAAFKVIFPPEQPGEEKI